MAYVPPRDRVLEYSTSNSQSVFAVTGAADPSYNAFSAFMAVGDTTIGGVVEQGVAFKSGILTCTASNQLTLSTVFESKGVFSAAGSKQVFMGLPAQYRVAPFEAMRGNGLQINGAMDVSQEKGTASTALSTGNVAYPADQFFVATVGAQVVAAQNVADAPAGLSRSIKVTVTTANASLAAGDSCYIRTKIEGCRAARLAFGSSGAQALSIGFWVKAFRIGNYSGVVRNSAGNRSYPFSFNVAASNTWEFKSLTIPGDQTGTWLTDTGVGLDIFWLIAGGSTGAAGTAGAWAASGVQGVTGTINGVQSTSDTFQLTGVIVLPGLELPSSARSALAHRSFDEELDLCRRYFEKSYAYAATIGTTQSTGLETVLYPSNSVPNLADFPSVHFLMGKRVAPTVTCYSYSGTSGRIAIQGGSDSLANSAVPAVISEQAFVVRNQSGSTLSLLNNIVYFHYVADARM